MKKFNHKVILLSFTVTAIVLFGSWFSIQYFGSEKPITDWIAAKEGIEVEDLTIDQQNIYIEVAFDNQKDFGLTYLELQRFLTQMAKGKKVTIAVSPEFGQYHSWWLKNSAGIIEAIENKHYTGIQEIVNQWMDEGLIRDGNISMNDRYIFIYLEPMDPGPIYLIFPIHPQQGGGLSD
jgi:hypothetical protein